MTTSHCIKPLYKVNVTPEEIDGICKRFHVLPCHRRCYWRLVARGEIRSREFGRCLHDCRNYKRAYHAILTAISEVYWREMGITFPPKDWQVPKGYQFA